MKIRNNVLYPFPVLSSITNDYINCDFHFVMHVVRKLKTKIILEIEPIIKCRTISALISEKKCKLVAHVECSQTKFRKVYDIDEKSKNSIEISSRALCGTVQVVCFVVAIEDIESLSNCYNEFNACYGDTSFYVEAGSILGISNQPDFTATKDIYDLSNVSSIISIIPSKDDIKEMKIELTDEKIRVVLPEEAYTKYSIVGNDESDYTPILHSMFALPALVYAIEHLHQQHEWLDDEDSLWFKVIKKKIEEKHSKFNLNLIDNKTSVVLAQELIGYPLCEATDNLVKLGDKM